ncbi:MAG TPA: DNA translocase FtsK 4TM domain-containing protein, partial [Acidimicrobiales bacterium]
MAQARHKKKPVKKTARGSRASSSEPSVWERHARDLWIVLLIVIGCFAILAEAGALGPVGRAISRGLAVSLGVGRFALPIMLLGLGVALVIGRIEVDRNRVLWGIALGLISICGLGDVAGGRPGVHATTKAFAHGGGWLGAVIGGALDKWIGIAGAVVVLLAVLVVALIISTGIGLRALYEVTVTFLRWFGSGFAKWWSARDRDTVEKEEEAPPARSRRRVSVPEPEEPEDEDEVDDEEYEEYEEYEEEDEEEEEEPVTKRRPVVVPLMN